MIGALALLKQELEKARADLEKYKRNVESAEDVLDREKNILAIQVVYVDELVNAIEKLEGQE